MTHIKRTTELDFGKPQAKSPLHKLRLQSRKEVTHDHTLRVTIVKFMIAGDEVDRTILPGILSRRAALAALDLPFVK